MNAGMNCWRFDPRWVRLYTVVPYRREQLFKLGAKLGRSSATPLRG